MNLYNKYRPETLEEIVGNTTTVEALYTLFSRIEKELQGKKIGNEPGDEECFPHVLLFTGPSGCGKTTLARIVAKELKCSEMDLKEVDSAQYRGVDTIRELRQQMQLRPLSGKLRVWILDEVHQLSKDAQNALLKALEDTPSHVYFILCTTDPQKLLKTIITRCMEFTVQPLTERRMMRLLGEVCEKEKIEITSNVVQMICKESLGSPRAALQVLDKIRGVDPARMAAAVESFARQENTVIELVKVLFDKPKWAAICPILKGLEEQEPEQVRRAILSYCDSVLKSKDVPRAWLLMDHLKAPLYDTGHPGLTMALYEYVVIGEKK